MSRPKTRDVVAQMISDNNKVLLEQIQALMGNRPPAPAEGPEATGFQAGRRRDRKVAAGQEGKVEKAPEGGYADRFLVVAANRSDQPRPTTRYGKISEEILAANFNVYFWRSRDEVSVKPPAQIREALKAAGYGFTARPNGAARWYGKATSLPASLKDGIES